VNGKLTPHQEDVVRRMIGGQPPRALGDRVTLHTIRDHMGISLREEVGSWGVWLETIAWVISYRPDLIPEDSPLAKALARRGLRP
jgi:hypothetical protein